MLIQENVIAEESAEYDESPPNMLSADRLVPFNASGLIRNDSNLTSFEKLPGKEYSDFAIAKSAYTLKSSSRQTSLLSLRKEESACETISHESLRQGELQNVLKSEIINRPVNVMK